MEDNYSMWLRHEQGMEAALEKRPQCEHCGEYIQDDYTWEIDGELLCPNCAAELYRKQTEDFMSA